MARLTKPQRKVLEQTTDDLDRFIQWIQRDDIQITNRNQPIFKQAGSPLQYVENALARINALRIKQELGTSLSRHLEQEK